MAHPNGRSSLYQALYSRSLIAGTCGKPICFLWTLEIQVNSAVWIAIQAEPLRTCSDEESNYQIHCFPTGSDGDREMTSNETLGKSSQVKEQQNWSERTCITSWYYHVLKVFHLVKDSVWVQQYDIQRMSLAVDKSLLTGVYRVHQAKVQPDCFSKDRFWLKMPEFSSGRTFCMIRGHWISSSTFCLVRNEFEFE